MKSKVLSLVLALTVLCSILSVSTVSYAADSAKTDPITLGSNMFNYGGNTNSQVGPATKTLPDRDKQGACILGATGATTAKDADKNYWPSYTITHELDLTKPFTLEYEFYSKGVQAALASGTTAIFAAVIPTSDTAAGAYINNGSGLSPALSGSNFQNDWHKVALSYDGSKYKLYIDDEVVKDWDTLPGGTTATTFQLGIFSGFTFPQADSIERLYFDNVYVYQSAYDPAGSTNPDPEDVDITCTFDDESIDTSIMAINLRSGAPKSYYEANLGGKSDDNDKALVLSTDDQNVDETGDLRSTISLAADNNKGFSNDVVTFEVDVYSDNIYVKKFVEVGFAVPEGKGTNAIVTFNGDGTISANNNKIKDLGMTYEANRWYKVTGTYTKADKTMTVYINGTQIASYEIWQTQPSVVGHVFHVGIQHDRKDGEAVIKDSQYPSMMAVDNYRISSEAYDTTGETAKVESDALDSNTIYVDDAYSKTVANVKDLISSGDATIKFYADDTYATELADTETITATTVLVATSPNETVREYYTFKAKDAIELTKNSITGMATASVYFSGTYTTNHKLMIAAYSADNELLDVDVVENLTADALTSAKVSYVGAERIKAFVWDNNLKPNLKEEL